MNRNIISASLAAAFLAFAAQGFAQSADKSNPTYNAGGSSRCDTMSGTERQQCLTDEGAKTEKGVGTPSASDSASTVPATSPSDSANQGSSAPSTSTGSASTGGDSAPKIDPDTPANAYGTPKKD